MSKPIPTIQKYMTVTPHSIGSDQTMHRAESMMQEHGIRHLPVLDGGKLVGIISDRDLKFVKGFRDVDASTMKVSDMVGTEVFTVSPDSMLDEVCDMMAEKKYGSAVVMDNGKLVGILTWVDALKAISSLMRTRLR